MIFLSESEMSWAQNVFSDINIAQHSLEDDEVTQEEGDHVVEGSRQEEEVEHLSQQEEKEDKRSLIPTTVRRRCRKGAQMTR